MTQARPGDPPPRRALATLGVALDRPHAHVTHYRAAHALVVTEKALARRKPRGFSPSGEACVA